MNSTTSSTSNPGIAVNQRLVAYSLVLPADGSRRDLIWQFAGSVSTLRAHNRGIPVVVFVHGLVSDELRRICAVHDVTVRDQGSYEARLAALCPTGWPALARNPLLHRFLSFAEPAMVEPQQVMICDCDTIFFRDVAELFDRYGDADVVAREELRSGRTSQGIDSRFIDDPLLARLAALEGVAPVAPFNVGVVLLNHQVWTSFGALQGQFVDYAWRFVVGLVVQHGESASCTDELAGLDEARRHATDGDVMRALPYPSANRRLLDEVAWWMTLGHVPGLRVADFAPTDVAGHGEFVDAIDGDDSWVMCRYETHHVGHVAEWLVAQELTAV
ncbi:MAG: hypothetical protein ABIR68_16820 [Ilumatobacteraceae bacterium]